MTTPMAPTRSTNGASEEGVALIDVGRALQAARRDKAEANERSVTIAAEDKAKDMANQLSEVKRNFETIV